MRIGFSCSVCRFLVACRRFLMLKNLASQFMFHCELAICRRTQLACHLLETLLSMALPSAEPFLYPLEWPRELSTRSQQQCAKICFSTLLINFLLPVGSIYRIDWKLFQCWLYLLLKWGPVQGPCFVRKMPCSSPLDRMADSSWLCCRIML